jgi:predicted MFS family arabinose efflux permease
MRWVLIVIGAGSLFGLFALSLLLRVAGWRRLMRGADVLCGVQLGALCISPGWFAVRFMPIAALAYLTYCIHWAVQWEMAYRRELQRRSIRL